MPVSRENPQTSCEKKQEEPWQLYTAKWEISVRPFDLLKGLDRQALGSERTRTPFDKVESLTKISHSSLYSVKVLLVCYFSENFYNGF